MKKVMLALAIFIINQGICQDNNGDNKEYKPTEGNWGVTFNVRANLMDLGLQSFTDGLNNNSIFGRYYVKDDMAVRLGVGATLLNYTNMTTDSVGTTLVEFDTTYSRTDVYLAPGIEKHFVGTNRLDPYGGVDLVFGSVGKATSKGTLSITDTSGTSSGTSKFEVDGTEEGGFIFGINLSTGFNYFIAERLSVGAEYSFGYRMTRTGGNKSVITTNMPVNGKSTVKREESADITTISTIGVNSTMGITLSYFFGK